MNREELRKKKNVVIVYTGKKVRRGAETDVNAVRCGVTRKLPLEQLSREDAIPVLFDGLPTDVFVTKPIKALRGTKHRPAPGGVAIGHPEITGGTLGMLVKKTGAVYILSNNHVLSNCNHAKMGDQAWQPARAAGGGPQDTIGHLSHFVPLRFEGTSIPCPVVRFFVSLFHRITKGHAASFTANKVDAAIARPLLEVDVSAEILQIGKPIDFAQAIVNERVKKSGWTSGLTYGFVLGTDALATVSYGAGKTAVFEDQIVTTAIALPGDSGSVVLDDNDQVVGLLFAGSDELTLVNKIDNVIEALGLERKL